MADISFLKGGGEMGQRMRTHDWSTSELGAPEQWPQPLRTAVRLMLNTRHQMAVLWGTSSIWFYNDAYSRTLTPERHPSSLGQSARSVWSEIWHTIGPQFEQVISGGESTWNENQHLPMWRSGRWEDSYWTYSYGPIDDEAAANGVGGVLVVCTETTQQVLTERRSLEERQRLAALFEQAPTFMAMLRGPQHTIELANPGYLRLIGRDDVIGRTIAEALPDAAAQGYVELLDTVYRTGEPYVANAARYAVQASPDDAINERYVDFVFQPIKDAGGIVTGIFVEGTDATERAKAEAALRASEARLRVLNADLERQVIERTYDRGRVWQVTTDLLGVLNQDGIFESSNPAWQATLGWSEAEIARTPFFDLLHPDDLKTNQRLFARSVELGEPALYLENRYRHADGGYRWLSWVAVPNGDKIYCSARDITAEKNQAMALTEKTAERNRIWQLSTDMILVADFVSTIMSANPAWIRVMGWSDDELVGRSFMELVHPDDIAATLAEVNKLREGMTTFRFENRYQRKDGSYSVLNWTAVPDQHRIYAIARDVTADREASAALIKSEDALRQAQKMEAVGQLTGGLAHDFNNLLGGIMGNLDTMQIKLAQGKIGDIDRYINMALGAVKRAASLTQRLLAFSRRQTLDPRSTDVNRLVTGMEELIRRTIGPSIELEVVGAAGLWPTLVDPPQLENTLLNLCINARDAMPDGGRLTIETSNKWIDQRTAKERDLVPGQYISLCVTDTGTGMTPDVIARAFDPFFTTKPLGQGTGLGLSMIYGFARQSGGQVRIYSELGVGTTLCVYLPRHHEAPAEGIAPLADGAASTIGHGEAVLVVDDEAPIRLLICEVLEDAGYTTLQAADGPAGLRILQSDARIDLLITDVGLPGGMNGRQMADAGLTNRDGLQVLFITGYAENAVIGNGHLEPGMHVLTKPFALETLTRRIREILPG